MPALHVFYSSLLVSDGFERLATQGYVDTAAAMLNGYVATVGAQADPDQRLAAATARVNVQAAQLASVCELKDDFALLQPVAGAAAAAELRASLAQLAAQAAAAGKDAWLQCRVFCIIAGCLQVPKYW